MRTQAGFTLLEVLVALTISAIALAALLRVSGLAAENSLTLQERMRAGWVAEDLLAGMQAAEMPPSLGEQSGVLWRDARQWRWRQRVTPAETPGLLRVEVRVLDAGEGDYPLADLVAYLPGGRQ